jgi:parallel beta-helix repeat protein
VNNAAGSNGAPCGGICLADSNNNRMHKSKFLGNGSLDYASGNVDFGVGFEGSSSGNLVEGNDIGGNANGVEFFDTSSGNVVRHNIIAGNPPAQVRKFFTADNQQGADIAFRPDLSGANNGIEDNFCLTYIAGAGPRLQFVQIQLGKESQSLSGGKSRGSDRSVLVAASCHAANLRNPPMGRGSRAVKSISTVFLDQDRARVTEIRSYRSLASNVPSARR